MQRKDAANKQELEQSGAFCDKINVLCERPD
jgi:hypothetical protein